MPTLTPEIKAGIFAGESGGDYDALFGFSNRPGGKFAANKLTGMTVDQAIEFSNPRGPYAQWVKGQIGRVATPMGGYQVVGTTLRAMKERMGLRGDEIMTPEMQDRIGQEILNAQGTGAWAGYKGPQQPKQETLRHVGGAGSGEGNFATVQSGGPHYAGPIGPTESGAPMSPTGSVNGGAMPSMPVIETKDKRKNLAELMAGALGNMGGGGGQQLPALPAIPGAARTDAPTLATSQGQRSDLQRQMLAYQMQKLNSGKLWG